MTSLQWPAPLPWLSGREYACDTGDTCSIPGGGEDPREKEMATYSIILAMEIPWTGASQAMVRGAHWELDRLSDSTTGNEDPLSLQRGKQTQNGLNTGM